MKVLPSLKTPVEFLLKIDHVQTSGRSTTDLLEPQLTTFIPFPVEDMQAIYIFTLIIL